MWDGIESNCQCYKILGIKKEKILIHLLGCEEDFNTKEYDKLKWWQKIFRHNPRNYNSWRDLKIKE